MTTVRDIIKASLANIQAIAIDETPEAAIEQQAFYALNQMIDAWQNESLLIYNVQPSVFPFVAGQQTYTCGTGGDFNTTRPVRFDSVYARDSSGNDYPIEVVTAEEYASIAAKYITTQIPQCMYDDGNVPLKNLSFWPKPSDSSWSVVLWSWGPIQSFTDVTESISMPPGYQEMIEYNLSVYLAPKFGKEPTKTIVDKAISSKSAVKRINYTVNNLQMPSTLPGQRGNRYTLADFLSGR